ncbi:FAD-binding monooxygenase [Penicillium chermesinum]|nr:FAD-binding monooxygenase [Penicillium chermesinum]
MPAQSRTSVAIVGGGPGGIGAAIALSKLPFLQVTLFEKNPEPREAGAGISLSTNAWKVLDLLGASEGVKGGSKQNTYQRNAYTGKVISIAEHPENSAGEHRGSIRARRTRLQRELLSKVPEGIIQYGKKLIRQEDLPTAGVGLHFQDGTYFVADLVIGADGLHSVVRRTLFPDHELRFTGNTQWHITSATGWWWGEQGHVYFSDVDDETETDDPYFEITVRSYIEEFTAGETVSWGIPASNAKVASRVLQFDERVQQAVGAVPEGQWREFSAYAGPRLAEIIGWNKVALVGDASHPLSGAFGSGATFAMEDAWILSRALEHTHLSSEPIKNALEIFNHIRTPYYDRMCGSHLHQQCPSEGGDFDDFLQAKVDMFINGDKDFIYKNDIEKVWREYLQEGQAKL